MRYFTIEEALACLPDLQRILAAAVEVKTRIEAKMDAYNRLATKEKAGPARLAMERAQIEFLAESLEESLRPIEAMGAVLKGLEPALVDFPYRLDGKEVFLCWRLGEKSVGHYHGLEEGFAGRKPLPGGLLRH